MCVCIRNLICALSLYIPRKRWFCKKIPAFQSENMVFGLLTPGCFRFSVPNPEKFPWNLVSVPQRTFFSDMETIGTVCYILHYILGVS